MALFSSVLPKGGGRHRPSQAPGQTAFKSPSPREPRRPGFHRRHRALGDSRLAFRKARLSRTAAAASRARARRRARASSRVGRAALARCPRRVPSFVREWRKQTAARRDNERPAHPHSPPRPRTRPHRAGVHLFISEGASILAVVIVRRSFSASIPIVVSRRTKIPWKTVLLSQSDRLFIVRVLHVGVARRRTPSLLPRATTRRRPSRRPASRRASSSRRAAPLGSPPTVRARPATK